MPIDPQYWAWLNAEWNAGRLMRPGAALTALRTHPRNFLRKFPIQGNFDPMVSGMTTAYLFNGAAGQRPGAILKTARMHTTETFNIQPMPGQLGEGHPFPVHGVHTGQSSAGPVWYRLDGGGPDLMLTAKLTGCTFVARPVAGTPGAVEVTHLQPHNETGQQLNARMDVPGQQAWGRFKYDIDSRSVNVIGVRVAGQWKIYAQKIDKHAMTIRSVHRIYPPE
ncbi:hypothetical protein IP84_02845 [beta proteobacterium AAP99]|nr:hypothetical protein IP84_02845 [beta proteobacterium AAP99]